MKKVLVVLLVATMIVGIIGCGSKQGDSPNGGGAESNAGAGKEEQIVLHFWSGIPEDKGPAQAMAAYTKLHPNVTFEFTKIGWDDTSNTQVETALMSGTGIDVLTPTRGYIEKAKNGLVMDLSPYLEAKGINLEEECGDGVNNWLVDNKTYMIPLSTLPIVWLLNKDMFDKAGLELPGNDWTMSEMMDIAKKLTDNDTAGLYCTHNWAMWWIMSLGDGVVDPLTVVTADKSAAALDNPIFTDILNDALTMQNNGSLIPYSECVAENYTPSSVFLSEKAAMVACSTYVLRDIKDTKTYPHDFTTAFVSSPRADGSDVQYNRWPVEDPIMVSAKTEHPDEATDFAIWLYEEGVKYFVPYGRMPAHSGFETEEVVSMFFDEDSKDLFDLESFEAWFNNDSVIKTTTPAGIDEAIQLLDQEAERALVGEITAEKALKNAQDKINELLNNK